MDLGLCEGMKESAPKWTTQGSGLRLAFGHFQDPGTLSQRSGWESRVPEPSLATPSPASSACTPATSGLLPGKGRETSITIRAVRG